MKFRKKPVVIEAIQYTGKSDDIKRINENFGLNLHMLWTKPSKLRIPTLEGGMCATEGDWIIKGVKGEFYPCKPDIFEATYEPVSEFSEDAKQIA